MTPTEERELLELAAKAYGYKPIRSSDDFTGLLLEGVQEPWNPLHNSGDCFDLAVRLKLDLIQADKWVTAQSYDLYVVKSQDLADESERLAATRLAITRAAAEIGRRMKG